MRIDSPNLDGYTSVSGDFAVTGSIINPLLKASLDGYGAGLSASVPYAGATSNINLGNHSITTTGIINTGAIICAPLKAALDGYQSQINSFGTIVDGYFYTNPSATTLSALISAAGPNPTTIVISNHIVLGSNTVTVPSNVDLMFVNDGYITIGSGQTLNVGAGLRAGLKHIFGLTDNTSVVSFIAKDIYPQWFGAKGDGINDDGYAIQQALNATKSPVDVPASNCGSVILPSGKYMISRPLSVYSGNHLLGQSLTTTIQTLPGFSGDAIIDLVSGINNFCSEFTLKNLITISSNTSVWAIKALAATLTNFIIEDITLYTTWGLKLDTYIQSASVKRIFSIGNYLNQLLSLSGNHNYFEMLDRETGTGGPAGSSTDPYILVNNSSDNIFHDVLIDRFKGLGKRLRLLFLQGFKKF